MPEIVLSIGDIINVTFDDTDGQFEIKYDEEGISIWSELPDISGRDNIIYHEPFTDVEFYDNDYSDEHIEVRNGIESDGMVYYFSHVREPDCITDPKLKHMAVELVNLSKRIKDYIRF